MNENPTITDKELNAGDIPKRPEINLYKHTYRVTSGMLWQDRKALILAYWILVIPQLLDALELGHSWMPAYGMIILERLTQLIFLLWVSNRWITLLSRNKRGVGVIATARFAIFGFLVWAALLFPVLTQFSAAPAATKNLALLLLIPLLILINRYFFYFMPLLCGVPRLTNVLISARSVNAADKIMSLRSMAAPMGLFSLIVSAIMAFSPDGREIWVNILAALCSGIFWALHCYLALGFVLVFWGEKEWHLAELDPYREARLTTLALSGSDYVAKTISPRQGVVAILISLMIWSANLLRLETSPPAVKVTVKSAEVKQDTVTLRININDPQYNFRGFQPVHFVLAGEQGAEVSTQIESAKIVTESENSFFEIPHSLSDADMDITFHTNRSGTALTQLEDLYLWYRHAKLQKLDLKQAKVIE